MPALLTNFSSGVTTDAPLSNVATTINSSQFSSLSAVSSPDTMWMVLDPEALNGNPEIVQVTAHTASATSVTVVRGQQTSSGGYAARPHPAGTRWVIAWTAADGNATRDASNLSSGTIPSARLSGAYTDITGLGTITTGTWSGSFGAVSGANLTSLNASSLGSGSVPAARLNTIGYTFLPFAISAQGGAEGAEVTWTGGSGYSNWQQDVNVNQMRFFTGGTVHMSIAETGALSVRSSVSAPTMSVSSTDGFAFSNGGGKLWMQDTTWVRTDKSFYNGGSVIANDGHLSIGYGGGTDGTYRARVNGNMNIASNTLIGGALFVAYAGSVTDNGNGSIRASANASCTGVTVYSTAGSGSFDPFLAFYDQANGTNAVGSVSSPANSSTTTYFTTSDYRLKRDVLPLTDSLRRIMLLLPVTFKWKNISSSRTEEGFLAHEVAAVVPTAVSGHKDEVDENGEPVVQQMELARLVPALVGAVQELASRVYDLESQMGQEGQ